ncbi:uncharacterized protein JCM10292_006588 [Rhodotorula paludigena]|uniref:uncharacterized protein n=1 Tax=Rhodotorula paludigena TaxID=86838 RepID=UPI00317EC47A
MSDAKPVSTSTVVVKDAWLSFDVSGVPFVEPCYANVLVKGFNDEDGLALAEKDGEAYRLWVWERYHTVVLRGAFLNALSRPFLIHLISLRPFDRSSRLKALARTFYRLCLIPSFLLFYLPARIFAAPAWAEMGGYLLGQGVVKLKALERLARGFVGSGWRNDVVKP